MTDTAARGAHRTPSHPKKVSDFHTPDTRASSQTSPATVKGTFSQGAVAAAGDEGLRSWQRQREGEEDSWEESFL